MKVALISNLYPPVSRGGAEQIVQRIAHELHGRGHDVCVISTHPFNGFGSIFPKMTERHVVRVFRFFPLNVYHTLSDHQHTFLVRFLWHLIDLLNPFPAIVVLRLLAHERPDVVLTHNLKGIGLQIARLLGRRRIPYIHTLHDVQLSIPSGLLRFGQEDSMTNRCVLRRAYEWVVQCWLSKASMIISPSHFLADFYRSRGFFRNAPVLVLPNPAPSIDETPSHVSSSGSLRLLFAGQLEEHKGVRILLEAMKHTPDFVQLHIAGEGTLAKYVGECAAGDARIVYHGFVSLQNLFHLLASSDATIVPSLCYENSPTIIYESLLLGVPVIASGRGGIGELLIDQENGCLIEPDDVHVLAQAIVAFSHSPIRISPADVSAFAALHSIRAYADMLEKQMVTVVALGTQTQ